MPGVEYMLLYSLPDTRLRNWYKKQGFIEDAVANYEGGKPKAYLITKFLR